VRRILLFVDKVISKTQRLRIFSNRNTTIWAERSQKAFEENVRIESGFNI